MLEKNSKLTPGAFYQFQVDSQGSYTLTAMSEMIETLLGFSACLLKMQPALLFERMHPQDVLRVKRETEKSAAQLTVFHSQYRFQHAAGHWVWLAAQSEPTLFADGVRWHGFIYDISEQKQIERRLKRAMLDGQLLLDHMMDAVITADQRGIIQTFNPAAQRLFGYTKAEVLGKNIAMLMPHTHASRHDHYLAAYDKSKIPKVVGNSRKLEAKHRDGSLISIELRVSDVLRQDGRTYLAVIRDLREQQQAGDLKRLRYLDPLTNLPDRYSLLIELQSTLDAFWPETTQYALLLIDIRNFKKINDWLTHQHGDELLRQVAGRLKQIIPYQRFLARTGADEFAFIISREQPSVEEFSQYCDAIVTALLQQMKQPFVVFEREVPLAVNIGLATLELGMKPESWLKACELALDHAKLYETADYIFFSPELAQKTLGKSQLELELQQALAEQQLKLFLQAKFDSEKHLQGAEVLLRWQHPTRGWVSPAEFIPLAEESELIVQIGAWVLEQACILLRDWQQTEQTAELDLAVNISSRQFSEQQFVVKTLQMIERYQVNPQRLHLELTESLLINNADDVVEKMMLLNSKGITFSLDDFGTGYSSLSYLKRLPLQVLKIDRSFVREMHSNPNDQVLAKTIVSMAHSLGLGVIAEGVEDERQFSLLKNMGCGGFQGFYLHKPAAVSDFTKQLIGASAAWHCQHIYA
ncbi:hypothetical protein GCM10010919_21120 [Alishewanella longhuensis]|uniref:Uncharacterized protein n=1 Tax=Alishewanella longhuensis TaxID=1091037 RepID=A0ABQ3L7G6_9ALTE|nr:bifunctional diguanylate cyclase/phosphodiesterase [Alishewanella longhuensis]GHG70449.1 hypothetical protein GCM10010919_21120 [Alishewanella longhuensis]